MVCKKNKSSYMHPIFERLYCNYRRHYYVVPVGRDRFFGGENHMKNLRGMNSIARRHNYQQNIFSINKIFLVATLLRWHQYVVMTIVCIVTRELDSHWSIIMSRHLYALKGFLCNGPNGYPFRNEPI